MLASQNTSRLWEAKPIERKKLQGSLRYECGAASAVMRAGAGAAVGAIVFGGRGGNLGAGFAPGGAVLTGAATGTFAGAKPCSAASAGGAVSGTSTSTCFVGAIFSRGTTFGKFPPACPPSPAA